MYYRKKRPNGVRSGDWGAGIGIPHDHPSDIYSINSLIHYLSTENKCQFYINILRTVVHTLIFQPFSNDNFTY